MLEQIKIPKLLTEPLNPLKVKSEINSGSVALIIGIEKYENTPAACKLDANILQNIAKYFWC